LERCAPGHHGYQRACELISGKALSGPFGSPVFACAGKTEPPSRLILSQTSAGIAMIFNILISQLSLRASLYLYPQQPHNAPGDRRLRRAHCWPRRQNQLQNVALTYSGWRMSKQVVRNQFINA
jgi:hypothetical protein